MNAYMLYYATGVIMIPVLLFSFYCQIKVKRAFRRYSSVHAMCGMTGAQAAARLLQLNGITDVQIRQIGGTLTDYYDPKNKEICLSGDVYNATSVAAIGVACHEAGHPCHSCHPHRFLFGYSAGAAGHGIYLAAADHGGYCVVCLSGAVPATDFAGGV